MPEFGEEIRIETLIVEMASFLELLRDHSFSKEDWTKCETCREAAEVIRDLFVEFL